MNREASKQTRSGWTSTEYAQNGNVELAFDRFNDSHGEPLLLIMGPSNVPVLVAGRAV